MTSMTSMMSVAIGVLVVAQTAAAQPDPVLDALDKALPSGWTLLVTDTELVIRHDRPCYLTGTRQENAPAVETKTASPGAGPLVTIQLRYHLEPRWTDKQLSTAKASNEKLGAELRALAAKYRIDAIPRSKGRPHPTNPDERARLDAYETARTKLTARLVKLPRCSLGDASVFDGDDTYAQLSLEVDPPEVMAQAHRVVELMKQHCG